MSIPLLIVQIVGFVLLIYLIVSLFFTVKQQSVAVIERFGRFQRLVQPGLNMKLPIIDRVAGRVNMRVQNLEVDIETKTQDNVFVHMRVNVQYLVMPEKVYDAFYKLNDVHTQISAFIFDVVRAQVPHLDLDEVFSKKDSISNAIKEELHDSMEEYGYNIIKTLVTDIDPDEKVKISMNEINAATRLRMAASEKGEADKIIRVKAAEADAESKALQGKGIADQRKAIVEGLRESVEEFTEHVGDTTASEVLMLVLLTQYFDTLKEVAEYSNTNTLMLPNNPGGMQNLADEIRNAMLMTDMVSKNAEQPGSAGARS